MPLFNQKIYKWPFVDFFKIGFGINWPDLFVLRTLLDPFDPRNFAQKCILKLVKQFSSHCLGIKSLNVSQSCLQILHLRPSNPVQNISLRSLGMHRREKFQDSFWV